MSHWLSVMILMMKILTYKLILCNKDLKIMERMLIEYQWTKQMEANGVVQMMRVDAEKLGAKNIDTEGERTKLQMEFRDAQILQLNRNGWEREIGKKKRGSG